MTRDPSSRALKGSLQHCIIDYLIITHACIMGHYKVRRAITMALADCFDCEELQTPSSALATLLLRRDNDE